MSSSGGGGGSNIGGSVGGGNNSDDQQANDDLLRGLNMLQDFIHNIEQDFGAAQAVPAPNDGGGGGVNIRLHGGLETEYLLSLVQDSLKYKPLEIQSLLTLREMVISSVAPNRPQPPALFMVEWPVVHNGVPDGYNWRRPVRKHFQINGVNTIEALYHENTTEFDRKMFRRIYGLIGQKDLYLVHYHF